MLQSLIWNDSISDGNDFTVSTSIKYSLCAPMPVCDVALSMTYFLCMTGRSKNILCIGFLVTIFA